MDSLGLKSETILHNLGVKCAALPQNGSAKNLIQCVENWLFVFNPDDSSVVVTNLSQETPLYQTLVPSPAPPFEVTSLRVNSTLTYCAYVGVSGVALMDLPNTRGIGGGFAFGKEKILCKCVSLDERYFACNPSLQVTQVRFQPEAPGDDLLLVLTSGNELRLYCARSGRSSSQRIDTSAPAQPPALTLTSLGHVTIDFQFLPPQFKGEELEFPILVLFQDGEVHMVNMVIRHNELTFSPHQVIGSLPFLPHASDNYAEDSSSILVLPCSPPLVCIASSTGTLHHCLLFKNEENPDEDTWHGVGSVAYRPYSLHVTEVVELKVGGPGAAGQEEGGRMFCTPVHLHADIGNISRYFCFHKAGVHIVRVPLVDQLMALLESKNEAYDSLLPQFKSNYSPTEHLLYIANTEESPAHLGFTLCALPRALILMLGNGEFVSATVYSKGANFDQLSATGVAAANEDPMAGDKLTMGSATKKSEDYPNYVAAMLKQCDNIPLVKVDLNASFTDEEIKQIYLKNMEVVLQQTLPQLDLVSQNMIEKVASLKQTEADILATIAEYDKIQRDCKTMAETLADKYEDMNEKHEQLMAKSQHVLLDVFSKTNADPSQEKYLRNKLNAYESQVEKLNHQLNEIRHIEQQAKIMNEREAASSEGLHLNPNRERALKEIINELQVSIQGLVIKVNETRENVDSVTKSKQRQG
uniref:Nuclear pore complex protein Nup88 n=1 Tax=Cacopsylla melanoneura TaxID=428564 RepID=A0A8D8RDG0_9HEMI